MKIAIIGNYGAGNMGDEMILEGLLKTLRGLVIDPEIIVLSGNPEQTSKKYNLKSVPKFPAGIRSFLKSFLGDETTTEVKNCDYVIVGGGGLFAGVSLKANLIWAMQVFKCYQMSRPVIMYGQSLGEIKGLIMKFLIKYLFSRAALIAVRDQESKNELDRLNLGKETFLMPDLAFKLNLGNAPQTEAKRALICLRHLPYLSEEFKNEMSEFLDWLASEQKFELTFIDFQKQQDDDGPLHQSIIDSLKDKSTVKHITQPLSTEELFKEFASASFTLGMRFHSIVSAIKCLTPFIAINYSSKVSNFLSTYGMKQYCLDLKDINVETLKNNFQSLLAEKDKIKKDLTALNQNFQAEFAKVEQQLKVVLTKA